MTNVILYCDDFEGPCCESCHEDYQRGWDGGGYDEMCWIYRDDGTEFAHVCYRKVEEAEEKMRCS